jgi:hypothetical protein
MNAKANSSWPSPMGLWSLFWRAVVLTPLAVVFAAIFLLVWLGLWVLPVGIIFCFYEKEWLWAGIWAVVWPLLFRLTRWPWFRLDSRDILNDQENI